MQQSINLQLVNEKMEGIWFDQFNRTWHFFPDKDCVGILIYDNIRRKYKFSDTRTPKLEIEFYATYQFSSLSSGSEIHLEKNRTDFVYLSRKMLHEDLLQFFE